MHCLYGKNNSNARRAAEEFNNRHGSNLSHKTVSNVHRWLLEADCIFRQRRKIGILEERARQIDVKRKIGILEERARQIDVERSVEDDFTRSVQKYCWFRRSLI